MVVLVNGFGQHSNRLFQSIHFEAFCLENRRIFLNISFEDMKKYYGLRKSIISTPLKYLINTLKKLNLLVVLNFDKEDQSEILFNKLSSSKISFVEGWYFRCYELTGKYRPYFQKKYSLLPKFYSENNIVKYFDFLKSTDTIIVGIHIRRGDYKLYEDGKYYYSDEVYFQYIEYMDNLIKNTYNRNAHFFVFSNEIITLNEIPNKITFSKSPWYIDQYLMTKCNFLIGPPSTFTSWASYIGEVPLFYMKKTDPDFSLNDFIIC